MNKDELIAELGTRYHAVDEAGLHEGNTEALAAIAVMV